MDDNYTGEDDAVFEHPINGTLALHTFLPSDVGSLVPEYLKACRERGIYHVRIVHGKGTGVLRESVHRILERQDDVESFQLAEEGHGGWGATFAVLRRDI